MGKEIEVEVKVTPLIIILNNNVEYTMMAYHWKGVRCVTFANMLNEGYMVVAPFPPQFQDEESLLELATQLKEQGFRLTYQEEQLTQEN